MANKYFCDKCKKEIFISGNHHNEAYYTLGFQRKNPVSKYLFPGFDLCGDCIDEIKNIIKNN